MFSAMEKGRIELFIQFLEPGGYSEQNGNFQIFSVLWIRPDPDHFDADPSGKADPDLT